MVRIVFIHIPKTAGTSFRVAMRRAIGQDKVLWHGEAAGSDTFHISQVTDFISRGKDPLIVGGHFPLNVAKHWVPGKPVYFATIREPIARCLSLFSYIQRNKRHALHATCAGRSFLEAIDAEPDLVRQISNLQCGFLSEDSERSYKAAITSIVQNDIHVNTIENASIILPEAARILRLSDVPAEEQKNKGKGNTARRRDNRDNEDPKLLERLAELNSEDIQLFEAVKSAYDQSDSSTFAPLRQLAPLAR